MHAARVLGDIAADRARDLRRRVGRVIEAVGGRRVGNGEIAHAGLHDRRARQRIDRDDPPELGERQHDAVRIGQRAAGKTGPGAARDHGNARGVAGLQDRHDLRFVLGQRDRGGLRAKQREPVAFVRRGFFRGDEQRGWRQDCRELRVQSAVEHGSGPVGTGDRAAHSGKGRDGCDYFTKDAPPRKRRTLRPRAPPSARRSGAPLAPIARAASTTGNSTLLSCSIRPHRHAQCNMISAGATWRRSRCRPGGS